MNKIRNYMIEKLVSVDYQNMVLRASQVMRDSDTSSILVKRDDEYLGIVTDWDLTRKVIAAEKDPAKVLVSEVMSKPLICLDSDLPMDEAFFQMRKYRVRHILVTREKKVVGILSSRDCATYFNQKFGKNTDPVAKFWSNYECLFGETAFQNAVKELIVEYRKSIPQTCKTAGAIDGGESLPRVAQYAEEEGFADLAEVLRLVENPNLNYNS